MKDERTKLLNEIIKMEIPSPIDINNIPLLKKILVKIWFSNPNWVNHGGMEILDKIDKRIVGVS
tara:strand:- start:1128 stop:1319 length:192 start_codon:yes stop_codon:yes gene_type:complete